MPDVQQHPTDVEACEAERGLALNRTAVRLQCGFRFPLALEDLTQVVRRAGVKRVCGQRFLIGIRRLLPLVLQPEQHAIVVVGVGGVTAETQGLAIMHFPLGPLLVASVERDQIHVSLGLVRIFRQRGLVRRDRAREVAAGGQGDSSLQERPAIVAQCQHGREDGILERRPCRPVPRVKRQRTRRVFATPEGTVREGQRVVRRTPFGKLRDRPLEAINGLLVPFLESRDASEAELADRFRRRIRGERVEQPPARLDLASLEQGVCELHASRFELREIVIAARRRSAASACRAIRWSTTASR